MTTLIFGGSAGIGRELCREFAAGGEDLIIVARDPRDLEAEAAHCKLSYGVNVEFLALDASSPERVHQLLSEFVGARQPSIRNLLLPIGASAPDDDVFNSPGAMSSILSTNLISVMAAAGALLPTMIAAGSGNIVGFGSIAAFRGRRSNVAYSAAKRGLESYFESLRHSTASSGVRVQFYRLGYVATQQTYGKTLLLPILGSKTVARCVAAGLNLDPGTVNLPRFWAAVGILLKFLPWQLFRRLNF